MEMEQFRAEQWAKCRSIWIGLIEINEKESKMGKILRLHVRILMWHLQITPNWECTLTYNDYHKDLKHGWFKFYEFKNVFKNRSYFDTPNQSFKSE